MTIFYVFVDEESDFGIRFYPSRLDLAVLDDDLEEVFFLYWRTPSSGTAKSRRDG